MAGARMCWTCWYGNNTAAIVVVVSGCFSHWEYEFGELRWWFIVLWAGAGWASKNNGMWRSYFRHQLKNVCCLFLFHCNYDIKDVIISSQFYSELLQWWSECWEDFSSENLYQNIIWNNKDIRVNDKPIFYKTFFNSGLTLAPDLRIDLELLFRIIWLLDLQYHCI